MSDSGTVLSEEPELEDERGREKSEEKDLMLQCNSVATVLSPCQMEPKPLLRNRVDYINGAQYIQYIPLLHKGPCKK